jgi:hypothetical protein
MGRVRQRLTHMDGQGVRSIYTASGVEGVDVHGVHCKQCRRAGCTPFHRHTFVVNAGMQECPASGK